jgi:hypothetical protein
MDWAETNSHVIQFGFDIAQFELDMIDVLLHRVRMCTMGLQFIFNKRNCPLRAILIPAHVLQDLVASRCFKWVA